MSQFTTAQETALTEAYLQCDLAPAKRPDFALVISGYPRIFTCAATYSLASGAHNLSTTNGFTTTYAWGKAPEFASSKLKEGIPEAGGFSIGNVTIDLIDRHGESTITRDLTELVSRQAFREGNQTGAEYQLDAALTKGGTTVTLVSTTGLSNGDTIWIGGEAILIGTVSGDGVSLTGCTRGYLLTNAVQHENAVTVYGYIPQLKGRPFWIYKGYQDLALSEWLPMWGGTIEHIGRSEPGLVRVTGRPTEWEMWGGSANTGLRANLRDSRTPARAPSHGVKRIVRLGQINDDLNDENASVQAVDLNLAGDYVLFFQTPLSAPTGLGDGHFALKLGDHWLGIVSLVTEGANAAGTFVSANVVKGLVTGNFPEEIDAYTALDLGWSNSTFSASAAPTGSDPIDLLLALLTSTGTTDNGAYDTYKKGIGLGIAVERIDLDSFTDVQDQRDYDDLTKVFFLFSESTEAKPFFDAELCKPFGWYLSTGNDGRIKLVRPKNPTKLYFSRANNEFTLTHSASTRTRAFKLPGGVYTPQEAASALQTGLSSVTGATFTVSWSSSTGLFTVSVASGTFTFSASDAWATIGHTTASGDTSKVGSTTVGIFTSTSFNTITENDVIAGSISQSGEAPQIGLVNFGCNYNWNEDRYDYQVFADAETANLAPYGEAPAYEINSKGLIRAFDSAGFRRSSFRVLLPPANSTGCEGIPADVSSSVGIDSSDSGATLFCEHLFDRYRNPPLRFKCRLKWKFNTKEIGDTLLWNYAPAGVFLDGELAADVLTNRVFEIVGIKPIPAQGCVEVDLMGHRSSGTSSSSVAAAPPDAFSGLIAWWRASDISGLSDGDAVSSWADSSGNGNTVTQTGASRPVYRAGVVNGKPTVRFDGTDDFLAKSMSSSLFAAGDNLTAFFVYKVNDSASRCLISQDSGSGSNPKWFVRHGTPSGGADQMNWHINDGATSEFAHSDSAFASGSFHIAALVKYGEVYSWFSDNAADGSDTLSVDFPVQAADLRIGFAEGTDYFSGDIAEIIVFRGAMSSDERQAIHAYLEGRYG